eukprot:TRINITY_DN6110_c0_g1_i1.p1 TRINITY_DN6110_c0_g1~~TRINITY_DN6110_c0_g1_i1.p1  ORF type:complete len:310 (+),score=75.19 TRINITY_DN6110_c0_g1_i1:103-1032(+)
MACLRNFALVAPHISAAVISSFNPNGEQNLKRHGHVDTTHLLSVHDGCQQFVPAQDPQICGGCGCHLSFHAVEPPKEVSLTSSRPSQTTSSDDATAMTVSQSAPPPPPAIAQLPIISTLRQQRTSSSPRKTAKLRPLKSPAAGAGTAAAGVRRKRHNNDESDSDFKEDSTQSRSVKKPNSNVSENDNALTADSTPLNQPLTFEVSEQEQLFLVPFIRTEDRKHQCRKCLFSFKGSSGAQTHISRSGHDFSSGTFECYFCSQEFKVGMDLLYHICKIHTYEEQPFSCKACGSQFPSKSKLSQHSKNRCFG